MLSAPWVVYCLFMAFIIGACFGSFVNCLQIRLQNKSGSVFGRSKCPGCGHTLGVLDLFPVFSFIFLRGKCRYCGAKISPRYLAVEVVFGLCYAVILAVFGFSWLTLEYLLLFTLMGAASLSDISTFEVPDSLIIAQAAVFLAFLITHDDPLHRLISGVISAVVFGGAILVISLIADKAFKKDSLGGADIKQIAVLGLYFTMPQMLFLVIVSAIVGIIAALIAKAGLKKEFPFIPSLAVGALVTAAVSQPFIDWYLGLFYVEEHLHLEDFMY